MNKLQDILYKAGAKEILGNLNREVKGITMNSLQVKNDFMFVAIKGTRTDGHKYIDQAIEKGAAAVICEEFPEKFDSKVTYIKVNDSAEALGKAAANFYDNPSETLKLVGVTGTNGKTTVVTLLYNVFRALGYKTGLLSTVVNKINGKEIQATHTTPDPVSINALLRQMADTGCDYVFMEVSSHAVVQKRIAGLAFAGGVFTNLTHDHLDYHKTFKEYLNAKKRFFDGLPKTAFALTNIDDKNGLVMLQNTPANKKTYGLKKPADFKGKILENSFEGLHITLNDHEMYSLLVGKFNAYNLLAVYGTASLLGIPDEEILIELSKLTGAPGRFEILKSGDGITAVVDYAHTPDALKNVLETIREVHSGKGAIITVVGAGGNRDKSKRPEMAHIASLLSDKLILTSDNPRDENPEQILREMREGVDMVRKKNLLVITDRKEAVKTALMLAQPGDIVLVAGKGHENYQEIKGKRYPFDDRKVITELFENK